MEEFYVFSSQLFYSYTDLFCIVDYSSSCNKLVFVEENCFFIQGYEEIDSVSLGVNLFGVGSDGIEVVSSSYEGLVVVSTEDIESPSQAGFGEKKA